MKLNLLGKTVIGFLLVLSCAVIITAQTAPGTNSGNVKIKNFGQMDERFYRGGQPKEDEYQSLKDLGVTTVINLRYDSTPNEKEAVEALGMKYVHIPMKGINYPKAESVETFLKLANDPATGKFFVHCKGGVHRTGAMGAAYRFTKYNWDYDTVYKEMKNYKFSTAWFHGDFKDFVQDYAAQIEAERAALSNVENSSPSSSSVQR